MHGTVVASHNEHAGRSWLLHKVCGVSCCALPLCSAHMLVTAKSMRRLTSVTFWLPRQAPQLRVSCRLVPRPEKRVPLGQKIPLPEVYRAREDEGGLGFGGGGLGDGGLRDGGLGDGGLGDGGLGDGGLGVGGGGSGLGLGGGDMDGGGTTQADGGSAASVMDSKSRAGCWVPAQLLRQNTDSSFDRSGPAPRSASGTNTDCHACPARLSFK